MKNLNLSYNPYTNKEHIVSLSGGIDSIVLLTKLLYENKNLSRFKRPIKAITFETNFLSQYQVEGQSEAIKNYIEWAKNQNFEFEHSFEKVILPPLRREFHCGQGPIWAFLHCYTSEGNIHIGYIKEDTIWEVEKQYFDYIDSMANAMEINVNFIYDFAELTKQDIVKMAKQYKIPSNCYWFCESSYAPIQQNGKPMPCGYCAKCKEAIKAEIFDLDWYNELFGKEKQFAIKKEEKFDRAKVIKKITNLQLLKEIDLDDKHQQEKSNKSSWKYQRKSMF